MFNTSPENARTGTAVKRQIATFLLALFTFLVTSQAQAQTALTISPITFGQMVVGGSGSVTIPTVSDTRSSTGSVALVGFDLVERAKITITHTPGAQVLITYPASIVMTGPNSPTFAPVLDGPAVQTIPLSGSLTIFFGGTITFTTFGATGVVTATIPATIDPL